MIKISQQRTVAAAFWVISRLGDDACRCVDLALRLLDDGQDASLIRDALVPLDIVKLDRIFISTMATSARQRELVRGIVQMAGTLGLSVVAEGIETERQRKISTAIGCSHGQGYVFSRPMSHQDAVEWTIRRRE